MYETKQNIPAEALTAPSRPKVCQTAYNWCWCCTPARCLQSLQQQDTVGFLCQMGWPPTLSTRHGLWSIIFQPCADLLSPLHTFPRAVASCHRVWLFEARTSLLFSPWAVSGMTESWSVIKDPECNGSRNNAVYATETLLFVAKWGRSGFYGCLKLSFRGSENCNWRRLLKMSCYFVRKILFCWGEWCIPLCKNVTFSPGAYSWKLKLCFLL